MSEEQDVAEVIAAQLIEAAAQMEEIGFGPEDIARGFELAAARLRAQTLEGGAAGD
jgi:hypothetical protein